MISIVVIETVSEASATRTPSRWERPWRRTEV